jgi:hypothetical protein
MVCKHLVLFVRALLTECSRRIVGSLHPLSNVASMRNTQMDFPGDIFVAPAEQGLFYFYLHKGVYSFLYELRNLDTY